MLATTENDVIKTGDPITSSNKPGYGMKATSPGPIIGFSLNELKNESGKIFINISRTYYTPENNSEIQDLRNASKNLKNTLRN